MAKPLKERRLKYYDDHIVIKNYIKAPITYCISADRLMLVNENFKEIDIFEIEDEDLRAVVQDYIFNRLSNEFPLLDKQMVKKFREDCSLSQRLKYTDKRAED
ncbi:MAG: hypothetical protein PHQ75_07390 [Thermoguttaceae bacterium]|nr:hypothetical protein [Thermoguttaceae bacterium]